jgi:hypothetical protein
MLSNSSICSKAERAKNIDNITDAISIVTKQFDTKDLASKSLSNFNDKKRPRSDDEKITRSTIGFTSTVAGILAPPVGTTIATTLLASEAFEAYHHVNTPAQIYMNNHITETLSQNKSISDDIIKDIIFDRCANQIP